MATLVGAALLLAALAATRVWLRGSWFNPLTAFAAVWASNLALYQIDGRLQVFNVLGASSGTMGGTAWWAHMGGFVIGFALTPLLSQSPLFGRRPPGPWG